MNSIKGRARAARPGFPLWMAAAVALCLWACGTDSSTSDNDNVQATVKIQAPTEGSTVTGPNVLLRVATTNFSYAVAAKLSAAQGAAAAVKGGHIHMFLDKLDTVDALALTTLNRFDTTTVTLTAGAHTLYAVGATADHDDVDGMLDSVHFTVTIP